MEARAGLVQTEGLGQPLPGTRPCQLWLFLRRGHDRPGLDSVVGGRALLRIEFLNGIRGAERLREFPGSPRSVRE
jgi:hypothetical protein